MTEMMVKFREQVGAAARAISGTILYVNSARAEIMYPSKQSSVLMHGPEDCVNWSLLNDQIIEGLNKYTEQVYTPTTRVQVR